jgi:hypothetical protein
MSAPILHELLARLPQGLNSRALPISLGVAGAGLVLWFVGARFSRSIFTLVGVALGAWVGLRVPRLMGWDIDAMAISIAGAMLLGFAGFLLHMTWVGMLLSTLLASAGVFIAWHRSGAAWQFPQIQLTAPPAQVARELWGSVPMMLTHTVPAVAGSAAVFAALVCWLWPRFARVLTFSLLSSAMLVVGGVCAAAIAKPQWLERIPDSTQTQGMSLAVLVVLGAAIQWMLCPRNAKAQSERQETKTTPRPPRDVKELGPVNLGPLRLKEARA